MKWKRSELIWYWADCMTFPFDHTHDLDPGIEILRSKSEIALSQEWDGQLTWNEKDVSHSFMTMILTSVTMMGWADVPDSDWGDFRRRRAIDISSWLIWCVLFMSNGSNIYFWHNYVRYASWILLVLCPEYINTMTEYDLCLLTYCIICEKRQQELSEIGTIHRKQHIEFAIPYCKIHTTMNKKSSHCSKKGKHLNDTT